MSDQDNQAPTVTPIVAWGADSKLAIALSLLLVILINGLDAIVPPAGIPLAATLDPHVYKCLFLDVGLATLITGVDWRSMGSWDDRQLVHEGGLAEQFIGQHLLFRKGGLELPSLCYWLREGKSTNAEVDFVIEHARSIVPVEGRAAPK